VSDFDDASLVLIPSGYKNGKVYSVKPTDGTGDLTFTRASSATRVASDGLIEKVRTNLLLNSATFVTQTVTVTGNTHTISFTGTGTIVITGTGSGTLVGTGAANRVSLSFTATAGALILTGTGTVTLAQLETGDIATDYIPTTTAAVSVGPVSGLPRLDYLNSTCGKLLLEPQRSNLATYSEQFNNAAWSTQEINVTANAAIAPDGTQSADNIVPTAVTGTHQIFSAALVSSSQCAMSVFAKANGYSTFQMLDRASGSNGAVFNLANGTVTNAGSGTGTITAMGNGWYRCTAVATTTGVRFYVPTSASNFTGDGTSGVLLWGCQMEAGAYATSYIPTLGASVTRVADAATKTGISSLIGQTEGTIFAEVDFDAAINTEGYIFRIDVSSFNDTVYVSRGGDKILTGGLRAGGSNIVQLQKTAFNGVNKLAFAYKSGSFALYVNGTQVATSAATYTNGITYDDIRIGGFSATTSNMSGGISQMLLFKTRLTNAQLAELTA
jgi:hypothetical protein